MNQDKRTLSKKFGKFAISNTQVIIGGDGDGDGPIDKRTIKKKKKI